MSSIFNNLSLNLSEPISTSIQPLMASGLKNNFNDNRGQFRKADYEEVATTDSFKNKRLKPTETSIVTTTALNSLHQERQHKRYLKTEIDCRKTWSDAEFEYLKNLRSKINGDGNTKYTWGEIAGEMQEEFPNNRKNYTEFSVRNSYLRYHKQNQQTTKPEIATVDIDDFDFEWLDLSLFDDDSMGSLQASTVTTTALNSLHQEKQLKATVTTKKSWNKWSDAELEYLKDLRSKTNKYGNTEYSWPQIARKMQEKFPNKGKTYTEGSTRRTYERYHEQNKQATKPEIATVDIDDFDFEWLDLSLFDNDSTESLQVSTVTTTALNSLHQEKQHKRYLKTKIDGRKKWSDAELEYLKDLRSKTNKDGNTEYSWPRIARKMQEKFPNNGKTYTESSTRRIYEHYHKQNQQATKPETATVGIDDFDFE